MKLWLEIVISDKSLVKHHSSFKLSSQLTYLTLILCNFFEENCSGKSFLQNPGRTYGKVRENMFQKFSSSPIETVIFQRFSYFFRVQKYKIGLPMGLVNVSNKFELGNQGKFIDQTRKFYSNKNTLQLKFR